MSAPQPRRDMPDVGLIATRWGKPVGQIPRSLIALLALVTIVGFAWALLIPPWQVTDENTHFAYVQTLAENHSLPGVKGRREFTREQSIADLTVGASVGGFHPYVAPPNWSQGAWDAYLAQSHAHPASRSDGGGPTPATNPPLFYLYAAIPYLLDHGGTIFGQLYAIRIWAVLLLDLTALAGWLLAGEVFKRRQSLQLVVGAVCALMPMSTFISTAVNPDALLITLWTLALWLGVRVIRRRAQTADTVGLCGVTACAILTKATSYGLVFPVVVALIAAWWLAPPAERRSTLVRELKVLPVLVVPVLAWLVAARADGFAAVNQVRASANAHPVTVKGFLDYLWQFYLPRLPFMPVAKLQDYLPVAITWTGQGLGKFGVVSVPYPPWVYSETSFITPFIATSVLGMVARASKRVLLGVLGATATAVLALRAGGQSQCASCITALAVLGIMITAVVPVVRRRGFGERQALLLFLCAAVFGLLLVLHLTDYLIFARERKGFMEGRYLVTIVGVFGLGLALIVSKLPVQVRPMAVGLTLAALLGLQVVSLATILHAYYL
jgi:4-amino-4-deoxy-L-arabinose transferase-like glycosyltransferase